jgi:hypothetical protein
MNRLQIAATLVTQTTFDVATMYAIYQATMRARRYINLHGIAQPRRIVLRSNGTVRAEINTGKAYGTVVAVVNK